MFFQWQSHIRVYIQEKGEIAGDIAPSNNISPGLKVIFLFPIFLNKGL